MSFDDLAVLIRADGMTSAIASNQIPGRLSRLADGKQKGILVDFGDEFSEWARRRSQTRFKIYKETGWRVVPKILS